MAVTRKATGSSRPRIIPQISTTPTRKSKTGPTTTSLGTTKKTKKAPATNGITKPKAATATTHHKRKPTIKDKVQGAVEKAVGKIEAKPGKEAAGTKKIRGTDGKGAKAKRGRKPKVAVAA